MSKVCYSCSICDTNNFPSLHSLFLHLKTNHNEIKSIEEYYINFVEVGNKNNKCIKCNNDTEFVNINMGYKQRCDSCIEKYRRNVINDLKNFSIQNGVIPLIYFVKKYGCAVRDFNLNTVEYKDNYFVKEDEFYRELEKYLKNENNHECKICGLILNNKTVSNHLIMDHFLTSAEYYDMFFKKDEQEGFCLYCNEPTTFLNIRDGYALHCCVEHVAKSSSTRTKYRNTSLLKYGSDNYFGSEEGKDKLRQHWQDNYGVNSPAQVDFIKENMVKTQIERFGGVGSASPIICNKVKQTNIDRIGVDNPFKHKDCIERIKTTKKENIKQYATENNLIPISELKKSYDVTILYYVKLLKLDIIEYKSNYFINKDDIYLLDEYLKNNKNNRSTPEIDVYEYLSSLYDGKIITSDRNIIKPRELDIFIPNLKLAIEFNGDYWHSIKQKEKNYHLNKSISCLKNKISLVHIYENDWINNYDKVILFLGLLIDKNKFKYINYEIAENTLNIRINDYQFDSIDLTAETININYSLLLTKNIMNIFKNKPVKINLDNGFNLELLNNYEIVKYIKPNILIKGNNKVESAGYILLERKQ